MFLVSVGYAIEREDQHEAEHCSNDSSFGWKNLLRVIVETESDRKKLVNYQVEPKRGMDNENGFVYTVTLVMQL